jgi:hypothetical protein
LEGFVAAFRDLLVPIIEDVQRFGLKARHLRKHRGGVDRFYRDMVTGKASERDTTARFRKRFEPTKTLCSRSWKRTMYHGITTPQKEHFVIWLCSENVRLV